VFNFSQPSVICRLIYAAIVSAVLSVGIVWLVSPWLQVALQNQSGLTPRFEIAFASFVVIILFIIILVIVERLILNNITTETTKMITPDNDMLTDSSIRQQVVIDELDQASVYLKLMQEQLAGAIKDTEVSVINLIECINEARRLSYKLADDIKEVIEIQPNNNCANEPCLNKDSSLLLDTRVTIALGNQEILHQLSEAFSYMQFQDVLRQRVEQIQSSITELDDHFSEFSKYIADSFWDGHLEQTLKTRMENHQNQYVMNSQRDTHAVVTGNVNYDGETDNRPHIELF
jgi:uncharacterized membrane protein YhdT